VGGNSASGRAGSQDDSPLANRPLVVGIVYLSTFLTGFGGFVGVVLAYVFRSREHEAWETSHFQYLIRTFWLAFIPIAVTAAIFLALAALDQVSGPIVAVMFLVPFIVLIHSMVRTVISVTSAMSREPMVRPTSWAI